MTGRRSDKGILQEYSRKPRGCFENGALEGGLPVWEEQAGRPIEQVLRDARCHTLDSVLSVPSGRTLSSLVEVGGVVWVPR